MKLSPYTIASNCTDINDCNAGLDELYEAYDHYKKTGKKAPAYIFSRVEKLEAKRDKCSLKEHGMKYNDYLLSLDLGITEDILQGNSSADFGGMYKNVTVNGEKKKVFVKISHIGKPYNVKKETVRRSWGLDTLQSLDIDIEVFIDGKAYKAVQHQRICSGYHYSYTYKGINIPESDKKLVEVILEEESKTDGLGKTKKVNRKTIDLYNEIIISFKKKDIKHSQNLVLDEYEHLICAFEIRQRQATAIARWSNHLSGTNVKELTELREKINKKIKDWEKADNVSLDDFMLFIALELRLRASGKNDKNFSFYVSIFEKNDCYTLRISDHHFNASTGKKATETTAVTFEKEIKENWDIFKSDKTVKATEYVYYEKELSKESLISIAKDIISFVETGKYNPSVTPNEIHVSPENLQGTYVSRFVEDWKKINAKFKETIVGTYFFAKHIAKLYQQGEKLDWKKAQKIAKDFGIETDTEIMQACELGCVIEARRIAHNGNSLAQQYEEMKDLYDRQVNIKPLDTKSKVLNQYSTPCPLAYLLGTFVNQNSKMNDGKILEPSAGNGLLTTVFNPKDVCVNELDEIRVENLRKLGFYNVANIDASEKTLLDNEYQDKSFRGIITNPPFAKLTSDKKIQRNGWEINTLDYKMAVLALDKMHDDGKASIIVGGKMWNAYWKPLSETSQKQVLFGQWKTFLGYLYAQYNVVDVIYVDGDNIYRKQGTQYPIAIILIDGRHKYDENNHPRYVFDSEKDMIIETFDQLFDRIKQYVSNKPNKKPINNTIDDAEEKRKRAKALLLLAQAKIKIAKAELIIKKNI